MADFNFKNNEIIYKREDKVPFEDTVIVITGAVWKKPVMEHLGVELTSQIYLVEEGTKKMWGKSLSCPFNEKELNAEMDYIKTHLADYKA